MHFLEIGCLVHFEDFLHYQYNIFFSVATNMIRYLETLDHDVNNFTFKTNNDRSMWFTSNIVRRHQTACVCFQSSAYYYWQSANLDHRFFHHILTNLSKTLTNDICLIRATLLVSPPSAILCIRVCFISSFSSHLTSARSFYSLRLSSARENWGRGSNISKN